ncbi:DUF4919 domain-containing protein [Novosphingobium decolorationis]|uniref:DUF4919 domain-containing protein n=1 Tax=Novosphingobium decolorationis TaxID=2698673 RepID=A0ABX8E568_9SPHN|nr:DUF4919 domain-containing protein [Novosphingobium decolorationis]QVM83196.1 DUF4919 domain-containing protein [Novosphingobium decolorationis]
MRRASWAALALAALIAPTGALADNTATTQPGAAQVPKSIAKILAKGDGATPETAYKVRSVKQEYQVLAAFGMQRRRQALVMQDKPYDRIEATHPETGETRTFWFDISAFFAAGF